MSVLLQARQMHARGSSGDVSARFLAVYVGGFAIWLLYGLSIGDRSATTQLSAPSGETQAPQPSPSARSQEWLTPEPNRSTEKARRKASV